MPKVYKVLKVAKGDTGAQGNTGDIGAQGETGDTGAQGVQGLVGGKGDTGAQGNTGDIGAQGETGDTGAQGVQGLVGGKGDTGAQGNTGDIGAQGVQGLVGEKGDTGAQGNTGDTGAQGVQGLVGGKGDTGAQGNTGDIGAQGVQGLVGGKGDTGAQGETGDTGAQGTTGVTGPRGLSGSAYVYERGSFLSGSTLIATANNQFQGYSTWNSTSTSGLTSTTSSSAVNMFFFDDFANIPNSSGGYTSTDISNFWNSHIGYEPYILTLTGEGVNIEYLITDVVSSSGLSDYFRLRVDYLSGNSTIPSSTDISISIKPAVADKSLEYATAAAFNIGTNAGGTANATNILEATVPSITSYGKNADELVSAYKITYNFVYKPWGTSDNTYERLDVWCSKDGTSGWFRTSFHPFVADMRPDNDDVTYGISKTFFVDNANLSAGNTLQLNIAVRHYDSSGNPSADTETGAIYHANCTIEPLTFKEISSVSGGTITTSAGGNATGLSPASTGVTRTYV